jgi:hypothetical protein
VSTVYRSILAVLAAATSKMEVAGSDETQEKGPKHSRLTAADMLVNSQIWWPVPYGQCSSTCLVYECIRAVQDLRELLVIITTQQSGMRL